MAPPGLAGWGQRVCHGAMRRQMPAAARAQVASPAVSARLVVHSITSDGHGLRLHGELRGGVLEPGDHLAFAEPDGHARPHLHVRDVEPGGAGRGAVSVLVDAPSTTLLDTNTVLTRVVPVVSGALLPIVGLPPGVTFDHGAEPHPEPLSLAPGEPGGSGPGYDSLK